MSPPNLLCYFTLYLHNNGSDSESRQKLERKKEEKHNILLEINF